MCCVLDAECLHSMGDPHSSQLMSVCCVLDAECLHSMGDPHSSQLMSVCCVLNAECLQMGDPIPRNCRLCAVFWTQGVE